MARREHSAGIVVFAGDPREYLLLRYPSGHWDFAKGHVEKGETDLEAARREAQEETGLVGLELVAGFSHAFEYRYKRGSETVRKTVAYFAGRAATRSVRISHEHQGYVWLPYDQALERITYANAKELLRRAEAYLRERGAAGPARGGPRRRAP